MWKFLSPTKTTNAKHDPSGIYGIISLLHEASSRDEILNVIDLLEMLFEEEAELVLIATMIKNSNDTEILEASYKALKVTCPEYLNEIHTILKACHNPAFDVMVLAQEGQG